MKFEGWINIMHMYLRCAGFPNYRGRNEVKNLLEKLEHDNMDKMRAVSFNKDEMRWEIKAGVTPTMGICMMGTINKENGTYVREHYFPYINSEDMSLNLPCFIKRRIDYDTYSGVIDDSKRDIYLIFRINNTFEYLDRFLKRKSVAAKAVYLSAWSSCGRIILPLADKGLQLNNDNKIQQKKFDDSFRNFENTEYNYNEPDPENTRDFSGFGSLSEELNMYSCAVLRMNKEDIYTIVESYFIPCGIECEVYSALGYILKIETHKNYYTDEIIYDLVLECNGIPFHVGINKCDLEGEPVVGRRFKGVVWMQGRVEFEKDSF
jgi:hypothetical protein